MAVFMGFGCNSPESEVITHYEITGFRTTLLSFDQIDNAYGKVKGTLLKEGDSVNYQQLAFYFESKKNMLSTSSDKTTLFPELSSSYIFSPVSADSIAKISVFSDQDFDEYLRAGDDLSKKFIIIPESLSIHTEKTSPVSLAEFSKKTQPGRVAFTLMLSEKPDLSTAHQFTVHYRKTDNSLYILNFPPIRIY
jgi:hypothetical protein